MHKLLDHICLNQSDREIRTNVDLGSPTTVTLWPICVNDDLHFVTPRLPCHNIVRFALLAHGFVSGDLARTSKEVTHHGTTLTLARLTAELQEPAMHVAPKHVVSSKAKILLMNPTSHPPVHDRYGICLRCHTFNE